MREFFSIRIFAGSGAQSGSLYECARSSERICLEEAYREKLREAYGIEFTGLYTITDMPVNRFLESLLDEGGVCNYMTLLADRFNPQAIGWDGRLYDCDFNRMLQLLLFSPSSRHIRKFDGVRLDRRTVAVGRHC